MNYACRQKIRLCYQLRMALHDYQHRRPRALRNEAGATLAVAPATRVNECAGAGEHILFRVDGQSLLLEALIVRVDGCCPWPRELMDTGDAAGIA